MKKSVYITGISCAILMLFGCIFKIMHWPGANVMIIAAVTLFCFWFLPAGILNNYQSQSIKKMKALHVISYIVFSICMMGVLFKIMHWPGASIFLLFGLLLPFIVFLPMYLYNTREEEKTGNKNFFGLTLGLTFLAVFSVLLAMSVSRQILWQAVEAVERNENDAKLFSNSTNKESDISKSATDLFNYTNELKCMLLSAIGETLCDGNNTNTDSFAGKISNLDNRAVVQEVFFSEEENSKAKILKDKITAFREVVLSNKNTSPELAQLTKTLFDTSDNDVNGIYQPGLSWEQIELKNYPLIFALDFLSKLQSNTRLVENEVLSN